jgi:hypothetical protein
MSRGNFFEKFFIFDKKAKKIRKSLKKEVIKNDDLWGIL